MSDKVEQFGGEFSSPRWLIQVISELAKQIGPSSICDPWAGIGDLANTIREACRAEQTLAITMNAAVFAYGQGRSPDLDWRMGNPLRLLQETTQEFDLVASVLPMGMRNSEEQHVTTAAGEIVPLGPDVGSTILVKSALRLKPSGIGLFVVPPMFFSGRSALHKFNTLGLGVKAAFALPPGTFSPYTNISAYLLVVDRRPAPRMFVGQLSFEGPSNEQVLENFWSDREGGELELGTFVDPLQFRSLGALRAAERAVERAHRWGTAFLTLGDISTAIYMGRHGSDTSFEPHPNAVFIPLIGRSNVVDSTGAMTMKQQNYAQVLIDSDQSDARFVVNFLNSDDGLEIRAKAMTGHIPKLNKQTLQEIVLPVPDLEAQRRMIEVEAQLLAECNVVFGLQNELNDLRRDLWDHPQNIAGVRERVSVFSRRVGDGAKNLSTDQLDHWFETLPFPLASILRAWQAAPSRDYKVKHEHLLHFFEATAEFVSVILLSAYSANEEVFRPHKEKLRDALKKQHLSFQRATFGTWKLVVEYLGKQTRILLSDDGKSKEKAREDIDLCEFLFADPSLQLAEALSQKQLVEILSITNKMRNDWSGHGGVVGQEEAFLRNESLLTKVLELQQTMADLWKQVQLVHAHHCRPRNGVFEHEISVLMGSNSEFLKEQRNMSAWLDVDRLYVLRRGSMRGLELLPLIQVGPSPQSAKNACYFFNRLESDGARFVSYHYVDQPELKDQFTNATQAISRLTGV